MRPRPLIHSRSYRNGRNQNVEIYRKLYEEERFMFHTSAPPAMPMIVRFNSGETFHFAPEFLFRHLPNLNRRRRMKRDSGWILYPVDLIEYPFDEIEHYTTAMKQIFDYLYKVQELASSKYLSVWDDFDLLWAREHGFDDVDESTMLFLQHALHIFSWDRGFGCSAMIYRSIQRMVTLNTERLVRMRGTSEIYALLQGLTAAGRFNHPAWIEEDADPVLDMHHFLGQDRFEDLQDYALRYGNLGDPNSRMLLNKLNECEYTRGGFQIGFDRQTTGMPGYLAPGWL